VDDDAGTLLDHHRRQRSVDANGKQVEVEPSATRSRPAPGTHPPVPEDPPATWTMMSTRHRRRTITIVSQSRPGSDVRRDERFR
jgi:hypothetical protein